MNIRFEYLYRDGANYKNWGEVVFSNRNNHDPDWLEEQARKVLIDSHFFYAEKAGLPDLHFEKRLEQIDHDWHQFDLLTPTNEPADDKLGRDILDFFGALEAACRA